MLNHALVELEARGSKAVTAARVAAVQDRHVVLFGHLVDGGKETVEVLIIELTRNPCVSSALASPRQLK